jgi:hypothetical protein
MGVAETVKKMVEDVIQWTGGRFLRCRRAETHHTI